MEKIEFTEKMQRLSGIREKLKVLGQDELLKENYEKLVDTLKQKDEDETLRIAVCGQYSAGKSTLVHALTNDDTIAIGQDVTTAKVTEYNWNGLKIADTPGIYAGRDEHDALSKEYIRKADLLIYMITVQGFTREIGANFKKLVQGEYAEKTMLLMNKRNMEPAENEVNWIKDTEDFLGGKELLDKYFFTIVDIEDYLTGRKEDDLELVAESHFDEFLGKLNKFIDEKKLMGKVVSRKNCIDAFLDLYIKDFSQKHGKDEFTHRQKVAVNNAIRACDKAFSDASLRIRSKVKELKHELLGLFVDETIKDFIAKADNVQVELERIFNDEQLAADLKAAMDELLAEVQDIEVDVNQYEKELKLLLEKFNGGSPEVSGGPIDLGPLKTGMENLANYLGGVTKEGLKKFVHFFGGKFKPWGADKWTKWLNGVGKWLGPLATVIDVIVLIRDQKHQEEMRKHRQNLSSTFDEIDTGIVTQLNKIKNGEAFNEGGTGDNCEKSLFVSLKEQLANIELREQQQAALQAHKDELLQKLTGIKEELALT